MADREEQNWRAEGDSEAMGTGLWTLDDAFANTLWSWEDGPGGTFSQAVQHAGSEIPADASWEGTGAPGPLAAADSAGAGSDLVAEGSCVNVPSVAPEHESGSHRGNSTSPTGLLQGQTALATTGEALPTASPSWQPSGPASAKLSRGSSPKPFSRPSHVSPSEGRRQRGNGAPDQERVDGVRAAGMEDASLPPQLIGVVPQSHFVTILDHLFDKGVTLGMDRLLARSAASSVQAPADLDAGARSFLNRDSPVAAREQELAPAADLPPAAIATEAVAGAAEAVAMPSRASYRVMPPVPGGNVSISTQHDAEYDLAGLPPAVVRKIFGFDLETENHGSSACFRSTTEKDKQELLGAELQASGSFGSGEGTSAMEILWEDTQTRGIQTESRPALRKCTGEQGQLATTRSSWAGGAMPLNGKLASALTLIQMQEQGSSCQLTPAAPMARLLAGLAPHKSAEGWQGLVVAASSESRGRPGQISMGDELGRSVPSKRLHLGLDGRAVEQQHRLLEGALDLGPLRPRDADRSGLALPDARNSTSAGALSVLPRGIASAPPNVLERDFYLKRLTELALALERNDTVRFKEVYSRLHLHAKLRGRARERAIFHMLRSIICRRDGTGADFHNKRLRTSVQEMDNARKWYFTTHPAFLFLFTASSGLALLPLQGRRNIHIVSIGPVMQWPMFLRLLKQDPAQGGHLRRVRLTIINTWSLVCPQRIDLTTMRSLGLLSKNITDTATGLGLEFSLRIVDVTDDSLDWFEAIQRRDNEALAVCTASELSFFHDDPQFCGGLRRRLFQALKDLRVDVFTIAENEVPHGSSPFLAQRLAGSFQFLWALLHSHDSLGIGNHRHMRFMEHAVAELRVVNAISTDGIQRRWRPMSGAQWHQSMLDWGFKPLQTGASALAVLQGIIKSYPDFFQVRLEGPWLKLMWEGTTLYSASAWTH